MAALKNFDPYDPKSYDPTVEQQEALRQLQALPSIEPPQPNITSLPQGVAPTPSQPFKTQQGQGKPKPKPDPGKPEPTMTAEGKAKENDWRAARGMAPMGAF